MEDFENQNVFSEDETITPSDMNAGEDILSEMDQEPDVPQKETTYRGMGTGRRESPYADSPYVMNHPSRKEPHYQPRSEGRKTTSRPSRRKGGIGRKLLAAAAVLLLVIGSCAATAGIVNDRWEARAKQMEAAFSRQLQDLQEQVTALTPAYTGNSVSGTITSADGYSASQVYANNVHSVVLIESTITANMYGQTATGVSSGSGFILTEDGYVVTNYHVVEGATSVAVVLYDGTRHQAALVGYDSTNDVAVLKVETAGLDPVTLGSSSDLIVGDQVVAIGNPLGELTSTLTVGYVSAKERDVSTDGTIINMLQTDCAINSGNSGGPLFNMKGEVVGITTAKYSGASSSGATIEGIGFAIPVDDVLEGIQELMEYGYIKSAYMGVVVQNMDTYAAEIYSLPIGAYVVSVEEGGAAHRAGIQAKDIIIAVDDVTVESLTDLTRALRKYEPGDVASVSIYRGGRVYSVQVTLDERPQDIDSVVPETESGTGSGNPEGGAEGWYDMIPPFFGFGDGD